MGKQTKVTLQQEVVYEFGALRDSINRTLWGGGRTMTNSLLLRLLVEVFYEHGMKLQEVEEWMIQVNPKFRKHELAKTERLELKRSGVHDVLDERDRRADGLTADGSADEAAQAPQLDTGTTDPGEGEPQACDGPG